MYREFKTLDENDTPCPLMLFINKADAKPYVAVIQEHGEVCSKCSFRDSGCETAPECIDGELLLSFRQIGP